MWLDVEKEGHEGALQFFGLEAPKEGGEEIARSIVLKSNAFIPI